MPDGNHALNDFGKRNYFPGLLWFGGFVLVVVCSGGGVLLLLLCFLSVLRFSPPLLRGGVVKLLPQL